MQMIDRSYWGKKDDETTVRPKRVSSRILGIGIFLTGALVLAVALIMGIQFPKHVYQTIVSDQCFVAADDSGGCRKWKDDDFYIRYNKLYYWDITNSREFLYHGQIPKIIEKGPYIYKEQQRRVNVHLFGSYLSYQVMYTQIFDKYQTAKECGPSCKENDQLSILNPAYFQFTSEHNGENNYILFNIPTVVAIYLDLAEKGLSPENVYTVLGRPAHDTRNGSGVEELSRWSFTDWFSRNDTDYKHTIYRNRGRGSFSDTEMRGLYGAITRPEVLGTTAAQLGLEKKSCCCGGETVEVGHQLLNSSQRARSARNKTKTAKCGLLQHLRVWREADVVPLTLALRPRLCANETGQCFKLSGDNETLRAYAHALHDYIFLHLARWVQRYLAENRLDVVSTLSQKDAALGSYPPRARVPLPTFLPGLLPHNRDVSDAIARNPKWVFFTCAKDKDIKNNFLLSAYKGYSHIPQEFYPKAMSDQRRMTGYVEFAPQAPALSTCKKSQVLLDRVPVFIPEMWHAFVFNKTGEHRVNGVLVGSYRMNTDSLRKDDVFAEMKGLRDVTAINGYLSWVSHPRFLYSTTEVTSVFPSGPDDDKHQSYLEVEPVTGRMWSKIIRLQFNIGIRKGQFDAPRQQPLQIKFNDFPVPVYWIEKTAKAKPEQIELYSHRVARLLHVSCGGLVGFSFIAGAVMIIGIFISLKPYSLNRVGPASEDASLAHP